ncbi:hypothetical protein ACHWQZ_G001405 [Mnemiopsis leidyi]
MCHWSRTAYLSLLVQQVLCSSSGYETEFAISTAVAIFLLITTVFFFYKWIKAYRSMRRAQKDCEKEKTRANKLEEGTTTSTNSF